MGSTPLPPTAEQFVAHWSKVELSERAASHAHFIGLCRPLGQPTPDARLKNRTLTKLYNERPTWLRLAHEQLDRAALAAYAATDPAGGWSEDWAAVWVESGAGQAMVADHPLAVERGKIDAAVLGALSRLNGERADQAQSSSA